MVQRLNTFIKLSRKQSKKRKDCQRGRGDRGEEVAVVVEVVKEMARMVWAWRGGGGRGSGAAVVCVCRCV